MTLTGETESSTGSLSDPAPMNYKSSLPKRLITPALLSAWGQMRPVLHRRHDEFKPALKNGADMKLLHFKSSAGARAWVLLSEYGLSIWQYHEIYESQFNRPVGEELANRICHEPLILHVKYSSDFVEVGEGRDKVRFWKSIDIKDDLHATMALRILLSEYEKRAGQCFLCRGVGFMPGILDEPYMNSAGVPTPMFYLPCVHLYHQADIERRNHTGSHRSKKAGGYVNHGENY